MKRLVYSRTVAGSWKRIACETLLMVILTIAGLVVGIAGSLIFLLLHVLAFVGVGLVFLVVLVIDRTTRRYVR